MSLTIVKHKLSLLISSNSHPSATAYKASHCAIIYIKNTERKRSHWVLWQRPLHQQKCQKGNVTTQTTPQKISITQRLRTDLGRSVGVTTVTKLVLFNGFWRRQPSHSPQQQCNQTDESRQKYYLQHKQTFIKIDIFAKSYELEHETLQFIITIFKITSVWICRKSKYWI